MDTKLSIKGHENKIPPKLGLEDGGQHTIRCANCDAPLAVVWITSPKDKDIKTFVKAKCCHCGDSSIKKQICGMFHLGPGGLDEDGKFVVYSVLDEQIMDGENLILTTVKAKQYESKS